MRNISSAALFLSIKDHCIVFSNINVQYHVNYIDDGHYMSYITGRARMRSDGSCA